MNFTSAESVELLEKLIDLIRKRPIPYVDIGKHSFAQSLFIRKRLKQLPDERQGYPEHKIGIVIFRLINELIEDLKPKSDKSSHQTEWMQYRLLHYWIAEREHYHTIEQDLGIKTTTFYKVRKDALSALLLRMQELEDKEANRVSEVRHNLRKSSFYYNEFVPRYDSQKNDFYDEWIMNELLTRPGRVVTLYGPAGLGKTSLAHRIALRFIEGSYSDAVIWVSAKEEVFLPIEQRRRKIDRPQSTFDSMLDIIGKELGNRDVLNKKTTAGKKAIVRDLLEENVVLLIIDNLETIRGKILEEIEYFLADLPWQSKAIVTARRRLLAPERPVYLGKMLDEEALKLVNSTLDIAEVSHVLSDQEKMEIINITDGNPLLIQNSIGYIKRGGTFGELRRYGQGEVLEYMYEDIYQNLLTNEERKVLHTLSLVPESLSLLALQAVTRLKGLSIKTCLQGLRMDALVRGTNPDSNENVDADRYELLPPPREFLGTLPLTSKLDQKTVGEFLTQAYRSLAEYYISQMDALPHINQLIDYQSLERENINHVMQWCYSSRHWKFLIELNRLVGLPIAVLGYLDKRIEWGEKAKEACDKIGDEKTKAWVEVYDIAWTYLRLGEIDKSLKILRRVLPLARKNKYKEVEAAALRCMGLIAYEQNSLRESKRYFEDSLNLWQELSREHWVVSNTASLGRVYLMMGNLKEAKRRLMYANLNQEKIGHRGERAEAFSDLAVVLHLLGEKKQAQKLIKESFEISSRVRPPAPAHAHVQTCQAQMKEYDGHYKKAQELAEEALEIYRQLGMETFSKAKVAQGILQKYNLGYKPVSLK
jgi:tetratricopeptide (TPR) repeat protein